MNAQPATVMNQSSPGTCANPDAATQSVQLADGGLALSCRIIARDYWRQLGHAENFMPGYNSPTFPRPETPSPPGVVQYCFYVFHTVYFYVDGQLDSTEDEIQAIYCN